ncbi:ArsR/SmtB family transcription factor [Alkanindiges sp. WGS2144]|uniref:ArsR/SmtB family transcription factor n=1 Tax=Alkanindiges sp. WGS2144 TaxID=3366808 RepID=UPI0037506134
MQGAKELIKLRERAGEVSSFLKLLANQDRLLILCYLAQQELNVSEIQHSTHITQPTLSQQLTILRNANVVVTRRDGKQIYYSIDDQRLIELMQTLYKLYCQ